ncbi:MAG: hypothetical protein ABJG47_18525 [Ekhidna sp.]
MEKSYQISKIGRHNSLKYFRRHLYSIPITILVSVPFLHYVKEQTWEFSITYGAPITIGAFLIFELLPTLIMHLNHYLNSKSLTVIINSDSRTIKFEKEEIKFNYEFDELTVKQHLSIYQKNKVDGNKRISTPWSNYSYLKIRTPDNKEFRISSLILTKDEFLIEPIETKYSFWPSISSVYKDFQPEIERTERLRAVQLNNWKNKFSSLTTQELKSKLERPKDYDELPRAAMEQLLKEKSY